MKKQLLLGTALFAAMSAFPQSGRLSGGYTAGAVNHSTEKASTAGINETPVSPMQGSGFVQTNNASTTAQRAITNVNWTLLTGSSNCYGMLVSQQRSLNYNPALNAISFIHRKSDYYVESPALPSAAKTGVVLASISTDFGNTFDTTNIWSDATNWGRYPQGGIYNPIGNTNIANAYVVGTGPTVANTTWSGNFYASKKLNSFTNVASTAPGGSTFFDLSLSSYPAGQFAHGWMRCGFSSTDDGVVRAIGVLEDDLQGLSTVRGYAIATGTFNGTGMDWTWDSIYPPSLLKTNLDDNLYPDPVMVWNQAGTIGYIVALGTLNTSTLATRGYQPIIYKMDRTANPSATWTLMPGIDFNAPAMRPVILSKQGGRYGMAGLQILGTDTVGVPFFNDYDAAVDANGKLHIGATFYSSASDHPDSLTYLSTYTTSINPSEKYSWRHVNGSRPYLYDFYGDGTTFNYALIDSLSSEGPGSSSGSRGFNENPWDATGTSGAKIGIDSRIQLSRTPDGKQIIYSWVESDSLFTNNGYKWNNLPDIKVRSMAVHSGTNTNAYFVDLGPEQNMTVNDNNVRTRATLHYMSPISSDGTLTCIPSSTQYSASIFVPLSVTNSNPYSQLTNNATWFGAAKVTIRFPKPAGEPIGQNVDDTGVHEVSSVLDYSTIFPNPAQSAAALKFTLSQSSSVEITVMNSVGQLMSTSKVNGNVGENNTRLELSGLSSGIYFVTIKAAEGKSTKKLIVE